MSMKSFKRFFNEDCGHCAEDHLVSDEEVVGVEKWVQRLEELNSLNDENYNDLYNKIQDVISLLENPDGVDINDQETIADVERAWQVVEPELVDQLNQPGAPISSDKWQRVHGG